MMNINPYFLHTLTQRIGGLLAKRLKQIGKDMKKNSFLTKEIKAIEAIEALRQRVKKKGETITLLCYCKEGEHCHRDIIKSLIEE